MRRPARAILFACVLLICALAFVCDASKRRSVAARAQWLQTTSRRLLRALGVRVQGRGPAPRGGTIACNHLGYLDILVLSALTPAVFVAKHEVASWPVFGWFARHGGTIFVNREQRADVVRTSRDMEAVANAGVSVILFPEGTSTDGREVRPFKTSLFEPAVRASLPVVPAAIGYRVPPEHDASAEVCWWGDMTLRPHLWNLFGISWIEARVTWGEPRADHTDRKLLAATLHADVSAMRTRHSLPSPFDVSSAGSLKLDRTSA